MPNSRGTASLVVLLLLATTLFAAPALAQRRSRISGSPGRGVPCGRSYIAPGKVCHIETPPSTDAVKTDTVAKSASPNAVAPATIGARTQAGNLPALLTSAAVVSAAPAAFAELIAPLREMVGFRVTIKNPPGDDKSLRSTAQLAEVHEDHLLLTMGTRRLRVPLAAVALYYTDSESPGELTLVLR